MIFVLFIITTTIHHLSTTLLYLYTYLLSTFTFLFNFHLVFVALRNMYNFLLFMQFEFYSSTSWFLN